MGDDKKADGRKGSSPGRAEGDDTQQFTHGERGMFLGPPPEPVSVDPSQIAAPQNLAPPPTPPPSGDGTGDSSSSESE